MFSVSNFWATLTKIIAVWLRLLFQFQITDGKPLHNVAYVWENLVNWSDITYWVASIMGYQYIRGDFSLKESWGWRWGIYFRHFWYKTPVCWIIMKISLVPFGSISGTSAIPVHVRWMVGSSAVSKSWVRFEVWSFSSLFFTLTFLLFRRSLFSDNL